MTVENCKRLLEHFEKLSKGEGIPANHRGRDKVIADAKVSFQEMKKRFVAKGGVVKSEQKTETKSKGKK